MIEVGMAEEDLQMSGKLVLCEPMDARPRIQEDSVPWYQNAASMACGTWEIAGGTQETDFQCVCHNDSLMLRSTVSTLS